MIDAADYAVWREAAGGAVAVPEPEPGALWSAAAALLVVARRR